MRLFLLYSKEIQPIYMIRKLLLFILLLLSFSELSYSQTESLKFVIRVDDILSRNTTILPRSIEPLQDVIDSRGGKITWGVMPHRFIETPNLDGNLASELTASVQMGHEVSQHGYIHICQRCGKSSHEMYCTTFDSPFTYGEQAKLVQDGLDLFNEKTQLTPTSFIPPGHISDETTYEVLGDKTMLVFSDDTEAKYLNSNVFNLPINDEYTWALTDEIYDQNLTDALADIKTTAKQTGVYSLMLHDPFIRAGYENAVVLRWMGELLDSLNTYYGNNIEYLTLTDAANSIKGEPVSIDETPELPTEFTLSQNFPNPFNPTTQINFSLKKPSRIKLLVYDTQGRLMSALVNAQYSAGNHNVTFDAGTLSSGMYIYSLTANGKTQTKFMTLVK